MQRVDSGRLGEALLRPVRVYGIPVGEPVDVLLDPDLRLALGLEVHCRDDVNRFLPWAVPAVAEDGLEVGFPLALLDPAQLDYYRERALPLSSLRRLRVADADAEGARVEDVVVDTHGHVLGLVVENGAGQNELPRWRFEVEDEQLRLVEDGAGPQRAKAKQRVKAKTTSGA